MLLLEQLLWYCKHFYKISLKKYEWYIWVYLKFSVNTTKIQHKSWDFKGRFERYMEREVARPLKRRKGESKFCHMREEKGKEKFLQLTVWFLQLGEEKAWIKDIHEKIWVKEWIEGWG